MPTEIETNSTNKDLNSISPAIFTSIKALQQNRTGTSLPENWEEYRKRTATYTKLDNGVPVWLLKPISLSPTICAQYGWECVGVDILKCVTCRSTLSGKLPKPWNTSVYQECVNEVVRCLKSAHKKHCPWPLVPSPDSFIRFVPIHKSQAFDEFLCRLERLLSLGSLLPVVEEVVMKDMKLSDEELESLCQVSHRTLNEATKSAMLLAALGWNKGTEKQRYLVCDHCHRKVGLWFYKCHDSAESPSDSSLNQVSLSENQENTKGLPTSDNSDQQSGTEEKHKEGPPQTKKLKVSETEQTNLNPLKEHYRWCPWVISITSIENPSECQKKPPGWQIFLNCLKRNLESPASSPQNNLVSRQNLTRARWLLDSWTSGMESPDGRPRKADT